jgi:hypothetical protein
MKQQLYSILASGLLLLGSYSTFSATPVIAPRADGEGAVGTNELRWGSGAFKDFVQVGTTKVEQASVNAWNTPSSTNVNEPMYIGCNNGTVLIRRANSIWFFHRVTQSVLTVDYEEEAWTTNEAFSQRIDLLDVGTNEIIWPTNTIRNFGMNSSTNILKMPSKWSVILDKSAQQDKPCEILDMGGW